ncbi:MAG: DUF5801 domain-containing protein, partial [Rhizobiaceae bacterium]|nr:DUF5801 domain-containing protein [Rhizobiaceae bacterium]
MATEDFSAAFDAMANLSDELVPQSASGHSEAPVQLAQASEPEPVDADPAANDSGAGIAEPPSVVVVGPDNVVRLPEGVSLEKIEVDGQDLVLVQPDGSTIVVENAALNIPTFVIGDVEIPQVALVAALEANGIDVAAGPDGLRVVTTPDSSGGNFNDPGAGIGDAGPVIDLLPPTALEFGLLQDEELLGALRTTDDAPTIDTGAGQAVDEAALAEGSNPASPNEQTSGTFNIATGNSSVSSLVINGVDVTNGGTVAGLYGTLVITGSPSTGYSWVYTLDGNTTDHTDPGSTGTTEGVFDSFDVAVTSANGLSANGTLTIDVLDDGPVATANPGAGAPVALADESDNTGSGTDGLNPAVIGAATITGLFSTPAFGADGAASGVGVAYHMTIQSGVQTGLFLTGGTTEILLVQVSPTLIEGRAGGAGGTLAFTIQMAADGTVTVTQHAPLDHPQGGGAHDDAVSLLADIRVVQTLTDGDGDTSSASSAVGLSIAFEDDGPSVSGNAAVQLDDEALGGNPGGTGDVDPDTANLSGTLAHSFGADGGSIAWLTNVTTSGGATGFSYEKSGDSLLIKQNGTTVITVTLNPATGAYTVTQNAAITHAAGGDENDQSFTLTYRVTDGDGDTVDGTLTINVDDDAPVIGTPASVSVDEDGLSGGNVDSGYPGDLAGSATTASGNLNISFGADGAHATAAIVLAATGATWSQATATTGTLSANDGSWQIVVNADGTYTFTLLKPMAHATANAEDDIVIDVTVTATD